MTEVPTTDWTHDFDVADALAAAPRLARAQMKWRQLPGVVTHVFTHFPLELTVYVTDAAASAVAPPGARWVPRSPICPARRCRTSCAKCWRMRDSFFVGWVERKAARIANLERNPSCARHDPFHSMGFADAQPILRCVICVIATGHDNARAHRVGSAVGRAHGLRVRRAELPFSEQATRRSVRAELRSGAAETLAAARLPAPGRTPAAVSV